jgi:hypothetical protein
MGVRLYARPPSVYGAQSPYKDGPLGKGLEEDHATNLENVEVFKTRVQRLGEILVEDDIADRPY